MYCYRCGVELEDGTRQCPLCKTVMPQTDEKKRVPMFEPCNARKEIRDLEKMGKGAIRLISAIGFIAILTELITFLSMGMLKTGYVPVISTIFGFMVLGGSIAFVRSWTRIMTWNSVLTVIFLTLLDLSDLHISWSLYPVLSIAYCWVMSVVIRKTKGGGARCMIGILSTMAFLALIDALASGNLGWFIHVVLPLTAVMLIMAALTAFRISRVRNRFQIADFVLTVIDILLMFLFFLQLFLTHYLEGIWTVSWGLAPLIGAVLVFIFLTVVSLSDKARCFFTSQTSRK